MYIQSDNEDIQYMQLLKHAEIHCIQLAIQADIHADKLKYTHTSIKADRLYYKPICSQAYRP